MSNCSQQQVTAQDSQICYPCVTPEQFREQLKGTKLARALTPKTVEALKASPTKRQEVPDPALSGLYLVIQPSGAKSWALRYRYTGKPKKLTLGRWPMMSLAEARMAATEASEALDRGIDPSAQKKAAKAAGLEAQLMDRDKVKTLVKQFEKRHLSTLKSGKEALRFLERFPVKSWGDREIHSITRRDVLDLLDEIVDSGRAITANRVLAHLRSFMNWCVERDILDHAPTDRVKAPVKENVIERVLTDQEIRWFWKACDKVGYPWGHLGKLLLLTGQRRSEVAKISETEVVGDTWHLSSDRTKNQRPHDVPLSATTLTVLNDAPKLGKYLLSTSKDTPVSGFDKALKKLRLVMSAVATNEMGVEVDIPKWVFHDLRRTCATGLAKLGTPVRVTEAVLNHVSGTGGGIVAVYQRHDYAKEKRQAIDAWACHVLNLIEGRTGSVERMAESAR